MIFRMDTDAVRAMAARLRQTANGMETRMSIIRTSVESAGWQSAAREEFIMHLAMMQRSTNQSVRVLRMMAQAADQKAAQWEAIANFFNGPFYYLGNIWGDIQNFLGGLWGGINSAINNIRIPSLPAFVFPSISGAMIVGGISSIIPKWDWNPPDWWPFRRTGETDRSSGGGGGGGGGGSWGGEDQSVRDKPIEVEQAPVTVPEPVEIAPRPYPQPPSNPALKEVTGKGSSYTCATYARARRPDIENTGHPNGSAYNYRIKFEDKAFKLEGNEGNLKDVIGKGYAIVWDPDPNPILKQRISDGTHGHVAIIEEVYADHVIISHAVRDNNGNYYIKRNPVTFDQLNHDLVWLIP